MLFALSIFLEYVLIPLLMIAPIFIGYMFCHEKEEPALYAAGILGMIFGVGINSLNIWPQIIPLLNNETRVIAVASLIITGFLLPPLFKFIMHRFIFIESLIILIASTISFTLFCSYAVFNNNKYDPYFISGVIAFSVGILIYIILYYVILLVWQSL